MKRKILAVVAIFALALALTGCWAGEIGVTTVFNADGSGTRTIVLDVMDDTLSDTPIANPEDPEGTEGKGAVINNQHITGGLPAIQTWLEENAPDFIDVKDSYTEGYHRYFVLEYSWEDFDDFLAKYETLVDLSPTLDWDDFANEVPTLEISGLYTKTLEFTESKELVEASLDWAVDGIWNDIYDAATLAGFVEKANISVLAGYTVEIGEGKVEELSYYDADALEGDGVTTGAIVYPEGPEWTVTGSFSNTTALVLTIVGAVLVVGGAVFAVLKLKK